MIAVLRKKQIPDKQHMKKIICCFFLLPLLRIV